MLLGSETDMARASAGGEAIQSRMMTLTRSRLWAWKETLSKWTEFIFSSTVLFRITGHFSTIGFSPVLLTIPIIVVVVDALLSLFSAAHTFAGMLHLSSACARDNGRIRFCRLWRGSPLEVG